MWTGSSVTSDLPTGNFDANNTLTREFDPARSEGFEPPTF